MKRNTLTFFKVCLKGGEAEENSFPLRLTLQMIVSADTGPGQSLKPGTPTRSPTLESGY